MSRRKKMFAGRVQLLHLLAVPLLHSDVETSLHWDRFSQVIAMAALSKAMD